MLIKPKLIVLVIFLMTLISCEKEKSPEKESIDLADAFVMEYEQILVDEKMLYKEVSNSPDVNDTKVSPSKKEALKFERSLIKVKKNILITRAEQIEIKINAYLEAEQAKAEEDRNEERIQKLKSLLYDVRDFQSRLKKNN